MRKLILTISASLMTVCILASIPALASSSMFSMDMGNAWKTARNAHGIEDKNDITIVYGGKDISARPTLTTHTTVV